MRVGVWPNKSLVKSQHLAAITTTNLAYTAVKESITDETVTKDILWRKSEPLLKEKIMYNGSQRVASRKHLKKEKEKGKNILKAPLKLFFFKRKRKWRIFTGAVSWLPLKAFKRKKEKIISAMVVLRLPLKALQNKKKRKKQNTYSDGQRTAIECNLQKKNKKDSGCLRTATEKPF